MSDIFESPKRLIAWADQNIRNLKGKTAFFFENEPCDILVESHPEKIGWKIVKARLKKPLPEYFSEIVADILDHLRSALDQTIYSIAALDGNVIPGDVYFPFGRNETKFLKALNGRCTGRLTALHPLLIRLKPYKGGNEVLWALNTVRGKQHAFLVPAAAEGFINRVELEAASGDIVLPAAPTWDSAKNEIELFSIGPETSMKGNFGTSFHVTFGKVEGVAGEDVGNVLETFFRLVQTIIAEIEAESKRLGIVK
ncbi:MAG: hypothetical protein ABSG34_12295 [Candidatus Sulfotelmatobacter sp.]|jgi:hypothetical protein